MNSQVTNMETEEIKRLTERFYAGETTEQEEKLLRALFSGNNCPEGLEAEQEYIRYCLENTQIKSPSDGFTKKIIDAVITADKRSESRMFPGKLIYFISAAAASVILFFSVYFLAGSNRTYPDTYDDPEIAYAETIKILHNVSASLNKGAGKIAPLGKLTDVSRQSRLIVNESTSLINNSLSKLEAIDQFSSLNYNRKINK